MNKIISILGCGWLGTALGKKLIHKGLKVKGSSSSTQGYNKLEITGISTFHIKVKPKSVEVDYNSFFYPLDAIDNWNRIYGKRGFTQYQFVIPKTAGREGMHKILTRITESGLGSFLAVLKLFGKQESFMSFPMEGYTLALDFPISLKAMDLFNELDAMVADFGGRLYLAKDTRMSAEMFERTYPNADAFSEAIASLNQGDTKFASLQSQRLGITL